jgi:hypothetical protein
MAIHLFLNESLMSLYRGILFEIALEPATWLWFGGRWPKHDHVAPKCGKHHAQAANKYAISGKSKCC